LDKFLRSKFMFANLRQKWYRPRFVTVRLGVVGDCVKGETSRVEMTKRFEEFHQFGKTYKVLKTL